MERRRGPELVGPKQLSRVRDALNAGEVVGVPTDTVYGIAARVDRPAALSRIFDAKGRPPDLALPVLIGRWKQVDGIASDFPRLARQLAARFWPGPLTLIVGARPELGSALGGDGESVGVRRPDHDLVRGLCRKCGPLAVTSANSHGAPPCTTAEAVVRAFSVDGANAPAVSIVLDGGTCDGVPSTVLDCRVSPPRCLREGAIPWSWVEAALR